MYEVVSFDTAFSRINPQQDLAFDTETIGKYGKIRLAQFYQRDWERALLVENPNPYQLFSELSKRETMNIVMQYSTYDVTTIQRQTGSRFSPKTFSDTFFLARLAFPHLQEYSLDALITQVLEYDPYFNAGLDKGAMQKSDWKNMVLTPQQLMYAGIDVYHLLDLYDAVKVQEESFQYKLDIHILRKCFDFQRNGVPVDQNRCARHYEENLAKIKEIGLTINVNSYKQVRAYIDSNESDDLGLIRQTFKGNERAAPVRTTRKLLKQNSFLDKFNTDDGRIYGVFAPTARSGRFTCNEDNLQQLPRKLKDCFGYDIDQGRVIIYSDYSQLELRCVAAIVGERVIEQLYKAGKDLHNYVAEMIFGANYTKEQRQVAKTCNFNLLYGGGIEMLQSILMKEANIFLDLETLARINRKWLRLFPAIAAWQEQGKRDFYRHKLGSTPLGRQYVGNMYTDQLNIQNQGFGAEIAKLAMHYMYDEIKKLGGQLDNFLHDAYFIECDDDEQQYKEISIVIANSMKEAWTEATKCVKIKDLPMPVTVNVGYNWGDIEGGQTLYTHKIAA